ncbi:hypothetical protein HZH68_005407 [Vespula germanica]|uniref:Uncharacterized protein n=3 Tax=Vespula TaxID=7451 RepID=A0A834NFZ9_VESGE|nr:hypothetical protein HZH68_005407 [Vespula germanica]KAF7429519.1 hypothetical protein H0235_005917 [Vespula pensylvanica]
MWIEKENQSKLEDPRPAISLGHEPRRLFVIVICITMDETRIMGSSDLLGQPREGKNESVVMALSEYT